MSSAELSQLLELVRWLQAVAALLAVQAPVLVWVGVTLWRIERRLYRVELELGLEDEAHAA